MKKIALLIVFVFSCCVLSVSAQSNSNVQTEKKVATRQSATNTLEKNKVESKTTAPESKTVVNEPNATTQSTKSTSSCAGSSESVKTKCPNAAKCNKTCHKNQEKKADIKETKIAVPKQ